MLKISQLSLPVDHTDAELRQALLKRLGIPNAALQSYRVKQRAIDARRQHVSFSYTLLAEVEKEAQILKSFAKDPQIALAVAETYCPIAMRSEHVISSRPVIIGTGPCGLFAGLLLARAGRKPILLERGKMAGERARDVMGFWRRGWAFNPESNVQYGEGGAGTFSDGKLYTQIKDREHRIPWLLKELVLAGAPEDILIKARPHIGTDRLITVLRHIREEILSLGGEVRFEAKVNDVVIENKTMRAVILADGTILEGAPFIFAIGHSSRDTFAMLHRNGVLFEPKTFSVGVRIEHPQKLVDQMLYGKWAGHPRLGSAPYKFVTHEKSGRTAYSFCMCPGGRVIASNSEAGTVVTNGMSSYAREDANANSGFMVDIRLEDFGDTHPLAGIEFQRKIEQKAFALGGSNYHAPAQLLGDFMERRASSGVGTVLPSYEPGVVWTDLRECLPEVVLDTIRTAIPEIAKKWHTYQLADAVLTGVETRSSSPIRIPRLPASLQSMEIHNFYPAGEGAGYAGGIISAAVDGMKVAEAVERNFG